MKKYVITENQLKTIIERVENTPGEYEKIPDMSFDNLLKTLEKDSEGNRVNDKDNMKGFVSASVAGNRAEFNLDKADSSLKAIAGKFYKGMSRGYGINPDDSVLADAEDLAIIIMSITYYYRKNGKMQSVVKDVNLNWSKNYKSIERAMSGGESTNEVITDLRALLRTKFDSDLFGELNPDNENEVIIAPRGENPSFQVYVNKNNKRTTLVKFHYMNSNDLSFFYKDFLTNPKNLDIIRKAINRKVTPQIKEGSLIFIF